MGIPMSESTGHRRVFLLGVGITDVPVSVLLKHMCEAVNDGRKTLILNVNAFAMNLAYERIWFRELLSHADVVFCDGFGVKLASSLAGTPITHRYTPPDWIAQFARTCVEHDLAVFLLGARPGVAQRAAERLQAVCPGLRVVGTHHGYFDKTPGSRENEAVVRQINAARPDVLILGLGMPLQEQWLRDNWDRVEAKVALTAGALFDYVSGEVRRGPRWMTDNGFEWLARLIVEPRRLWRRYIIGNPLFFWRVVKETYLRPRVSRSRADHG